MWRLMLSILMQSFDHPHRKQTRNYQDRPDSASQIVERGRENQVSESDDICLKASYRPVNVSTMGREAFENNFGIILASLGALSDPMAERRMPRWGLEV